MRRQFLSTLLFLFGVGSYAGEEPRPILGSVATITATPIALDLDDPGRRQVGALSFLAGWRLTSRDRAFGSVSAMAVSGRRFTLVSDAGGIISFDLDGSGRLSGARFGDLFAGPGRGALKKDRDAEALAIDPVSGRAWIAYERWNAIWRYSPALGRAERWARPVAMARWRSNSGAEAMVRLPSGRFIVFSEGNRSRVAAALLFGGDPTDPAARPLRFGYRGPPGYRVTDAAPLPDGRLLLLHRKVAFPYRITTKLTIVDPRAIRAGNVVKGAEIATIAPPLVSDNYEALAITREAGRTIVWIASDDNFSVLQQTLLLKFELGDALP